jgi:hypothetical protein
MTRLALTLVVTVIAAVNIYSQNVEVQPKADTNAKAGTEFKPGTIELITPWIIIPGQKSSFSNERRLKSCLDFESLSYDCGRNPEVSYGTRIGANWDIFQITGGYADRTRMVEIGKFGWTDKFTVPNVEPWPALAAGEKRAITFNASGTSVPSAATGKTDSVGIADMNGNGTFTPKTRSASSSGTTYATANVKQQVSSTVKGADGKVRNDAYSRLVEVKQGYMYVVHVVNANSEFYVLVHVDDVVHGESVKLSFIKILIGEL